MKYWSPCTICGEVSSTHDPKHAAKRKYCKSRTCMWIGRRREYPAKEHYIVCLRCGAKHRVKDGYEAKNRLYCGRVCAGLGRKDVIGNKWAYRYDTVGRDAYYKRAQLLKKPGPCERCGEKGEVVHHRDHNWKNNELDNLERLCRPCHARHHKKPLTTDNNATTFYRDR